MQKQLAAHDRGGICAHFATLKCQETVMCTLSTLRHFDIKVMGTAK